MFQQNHAVKLNYNNKSFPFDVIRYREVDNYTDQQIKKIIDKVWRSLPKLNNPPHKSDRKRYREMVKNYVLNLIKAYLSGNCIRISRVRNDHIYNERYSQIYTTSSIVINSMDALFENNWIDMKIGFFDKKRNKGKQTRIFPSEKFINLIEQTKGITNEKIIFVKEDAKELIQLRHKINKNKYHLLSYEDTPETVMMRNRVSKYNGYMDKVITSVSLTRKTLTEMKEEHKGTLNNMLLNGSIEFNTYEITHRRTNRNKYIKKYHNNIPKPSSNYYNVLHDNYQDTTTNTHRNNKEKESTITNTLASISLYDGKNNRDQVYYSIDHILKAYPNSRKFTFRIHPSKMFRVFSDTFNQHGRFYGDTVQNLPKWMRTKITMNFDKVVECDYTSIHPTMLYVMAAAVPPNNIYMIDKETNPQLRKEYKTVLLVSINHKNPDTMWSAVSLHFRESFGYKAGDVRLTKKYIMEIYTRLLEHNKPIAKYMNTGVAMELMRKDSEIADRIIHEFVINKIPIKCIHDSFIVPIKYEQTLRTLMVKYFQEVMETDYVIGITTETASGRVADTPVFHPKVGKVAGSADDEKANEKDNSEDNMKYFIELSKKDEWGCSDDDVFILPPEYRFRVYRNYANVRM